MNYQIYNEDCLEGMKRIPDGSVDMIIDDLPFGTTNLSVDKKIPLDKMWEQFFRVTKENAAIILFSQMPFGAELITSCAKYYRYEIIYEKSLPTGYLNAHKMPMRIHENILVFYRKLPTYNPQMTQGKPYQHSNETRTTNYRIHKSLGSKSEGERYPVDVLKFRQPFCSNATNNYHPQQKPTDLLEYLIKTYTNGSGSTGVAAVNINRRFIGFELSKEYFDMARGRIESAAVRREELTRRMKFSEAQIVEISTDELIPYENNPRNNDNAVEAVAKSISEFGFKVPIIVDRERKIICGHTRLKAAKKLGLKTVPVIIAEDLTHEEIKAYSKTSELSTWAVEDLNQELSELTNFNMKEFGFTEKELESVEITPAEFGESFSLSTEKGNERKKFTETFVFHKKQMELINQAISTVGGKPSKAIYEIVRQWQEHRQNVGTS